jgi:circadian clock protein KaiB
MGNATLHRFRLFVAAHAKTSTQAISNLQMLCRTYLPGCHEVEIVDVFKEPNLALAQGVFMTPTLVRLAPAPERRIVGTLGQTQLVLQALGLDPTAP